MKKILFVLAWILLPLKVFPAEAVDLYGLNKPHAQAILKKYANTISELESYAEKSGILTGEPKDKKAFEEFIKKRQSLMEKLKKEEGLLFVNFQTIYYPGGKQYITLEVIDKNQPERLRFLSPPPLKSKSYKGDLIDQMTEYANKGMNLFFSNKITTEELTLCPVYHCMSGFKHPDLKPYLAIFNKGIVKEKKLIIATLNHDPDAERRTAAAYLIGHFTSPKEIIERLTPHVNDPDDGVRNAVVRVIWATMLKANMTNINIEPFIKLLDSPYTTDRNKSLLVLQKAAESDSCKKAIIPHAATLLKLLQLQQPNNHTPAYQLLRTISGQNFGERDISAWQKWVNDKELS